ncbi:hypothetical protein CEP52_006594 [Fusarium oligoseptatum]|uniref:Uncharacterized protein n=1 Tax=Fusarium oligoseptatum TaxID=2604345 RepID=A0A428TS93_9HYPO|nr:hypothetical protein CEP52_006594 [Fusarium oligoseptatum]
MDNPENKHLIRYKVKYIGKGGGDVILDKNPDAVYDAEEPPIFEHIDVRLSSLSNITEKGRPRYPLQNPSRNRPLLHQHLFTCCC